jgi:hypothetical protein
MDYRKTKFYKELDHYTACETVEWSEDATEEEQLTAWQWLVDTGSCWGLQGWYGRTASALLEDGIIQQPIEDHKDYYGNKIKGTGKRKTKSEK